MAVALIRVFEVVLRHACQNRSRSGLQPRDDATVFYSNILLGVANGGVGRHGVHAGAELARPRVLGD